MRKPIFLQKNYTLNEEGYQLKLPLNLETIIPEDDSVRLLSQFVEGMDLTDLYSTYERINSVSPRTLLKIGKRWITTRVSEPGNPKLAGSPVNQAVVPVPMALMTGKIPDFQAQTQPSSSLEIKVNDISLCVTE